MKDKLILKILDIQICPSEIITGSNVKLDTLSTLYTMYYFMDVESITLKKWVAQSTQKYKFCWLFYFINNTLYSVTSNSLSPYGQ